LVGYSYTTYGCISTDHPAVDFETGAAKLLSKSWLVDGVRDDVLRVRMMKIEGIHIDPGGRDAWFIRPHEVDEVAGDGR
jgi:hypothetical protein